MSRGEGTRWEGARQCLEVVGRRRRRQLVRRQKGPCGPTLPPSPLQARLPERGGRGGGLRHLLPGAAQGGRQRVAGGRRLAAPPYPARVWLPAQPSQPRLPPCCRSSTACRCPTRATNCTTRVSRAEPWPSRPRPGGTAGRREAPPATRFEPRRTTLGFKPTPHPLPGWNACSSCYGEPGKSRKYLVLPGLKSGRIYGAAAAAANEGGWGSVGLRGCCPRRPRLPAAPQEGSTPSLLATLPLSAPHRPASLTLVSLLPYGAVQRLTLRRMSASPPWPRLWSPRRSRRARRQAGASWRSASPAGDLGRAAPAAAPDTLLCTRHVWVCAWAPLPPPPLQSKTGLSYLHTSHCLASGEVRGRGAPALQSPAV